MLLPLLILIPLIGGLICIKYSRTNFYLTKKIPLIVMIILLSVTLLEWLIKYKKLFFLKKNNFFQYVDEFYFEWIPSFGINFHIAIDGFSFLMILLTIFLSILAIISSQYNKKKYFDGYFYFNLLFIVSGIIGIFLSVDLFLFFFFWEIILFPIYFLISIYGNKNFNIKYRISSGRKFFIYSQIGSLLMIISIISLSLINYENTKILTFNYKYLLNIKFSKLQEYFLMLGFFLPFAIKIPLIPLHGWLPNLHKYSTTNNSLDISSLIIKTAFYGLIRFTIPLFPYASKKFSLIIMILGIINIIYGSLVTLYQKNIKKLISYINISHMGYILISIYSRSILTYQVIVIQIICSTLSIAGLFIINSQIYKNFNTNNFKKIIFLIKYTKYVPHLSLFFILSIIGLPGTGNFVGEIIMLIGLYKTHPIIAILTIFSIFFYSISLLNIILRIYFTPIKKFDYVNTKLKNKYFSLILIFIIIIFIGIFPNNIINITSTIMENTCNIFLK